MEHFDKKKERVTRSISKFISVLVLCGCMAFANSASANTYTPTTNSDPGFTAVDNATGQITAGAGAGQVSLRSIMKAIDNIGGTHTVNLPVGLGTYTLTQGEIQFASTFNTNVTFNGTGGTAIISQTTNNRIFFINPSYSLSVQVTMNNLQIQNGNLKSDPFGGGAIEFPSTDQTCSLTIVGCSFINNQVPTDPTMTNTYGGSGGAVDFGGVGQLSITNSTFTNNKCFDSNGGAISYRLLNGYGGTNCNVTITGCTFSGNSCPVPVGADGGAIWIMSQGRQGAPTPTFENLTVNINKNTFSGNSAPGGFGGAMILNSGDAAYSFDVHYNRFVNNTALSTSTSAVAKVPAAGSVNADNNWWGCNTNPTTAGACNRAGQSGAPVGTFTTSPWLQLKVTEANDPICNTPAGLGNTNLITASFLSNSSNLAVPVANLDRLIGLTVVWGPTVLGSLSAQQTTIQASGTATALFTSNGTGGTATVNAQVDQVPNNETTPSRASFTVNTIPVVGNPSNVTSCVGGTAVFSSSILGTPAPAINWRKGGVNLVNGVQGSGSTVSGATTSSLTITNVQPGDAATDYSVQAVNQCGTDISADATLFVNQVTGGTVGSDQIICSGGDPALFTESGASTGSGALTYQWQSSTTSCAAGFGNIGGATSTTYNPPPGLAQTTFYRRVTTSTLNATPCTANSNCITVTVNAVTGGTVAADQTICSGGDPAAFTQSVASSGSGALTYQWQSSTASCAGGFSDIGGAIGTTYDPPGSVVTTFYRRVTTSDLSGVLCTANSNCVTVFVNDVTGGTVGSDQTVCSGGNPAAFTQSVASSGSGALTYQWQSSTTDCVSGFSDIGGATAITYDPPGGFLQTTYYRRMTTSTLNLVPCSAFSNCITVTKNSVTGGTVGSDQTICSGGDPAPFTESVPSTGTALSYQWQSSTANCGGGFSDIGGATGTTYDPPAGLAQTTFYHRVTTSTLNGVPCTTISNCITVTINNVTGGTIGSDQALCSPADPAIIVQTVASTGSGALTYQWESSTTSCAAGFSPIGGATSISYDPPPGLTQTTYYRRVTTSTLAGVPCTANSNCVTKSITPNNTITLISPPGTDNQTVLINTPITNIQYSTTGATGATFSGLPPGVTGSWAGNVVTISGSPTSNAGSPYNYTVTLTGGCAVVTATGTITVVVCSITRTSPAGTDNQSVCINTPITSIQYSTTGATNATFSGLPAGVTGAWAANVVTISGSPSQYGVFTYTVTPTGGGCNGAATATGTITINPDTWTGTVSINWFIAGNWTCGVPGPTTDVTIPSAPANQPLIAGGAAQVHNITIQAGATVTNNSTLNINGGGVVVNNGTYTGNGAFTGALFNNNGGQVSPGNSPGCMSFGAGYTNGSGTENIEIGGTTPCTTYDQLQVTGTATLSGTLNVTLFGGYVPSCGESYKIMTSTTLVGTFTTINYPVPPAGLTWSIAYNSPGIGDVTVSISGTPTATATPSSQTICSGSGITPIVLSGSPIGGTTYNWTRDNLAVTGIAAGGSGNISGTLTNATSSPVTVTFTITPTAGSCTGPSTTATVVVNPTPDVTQPADLQVCNGASSAPVNFTGSVAGTTFSWTNNTPSIGLAASGTGDIASFTGTNATNAPVTATITVTPSTSSPGVAYVAAYNPGNVTVINAATNAVVTTIPTFVGAEGVSVSPATNRVYVCNNSSNNVSVINSLTNTVVATVTVGTNPNGLVVLPNGSFVYVPNFNSGNVMVIDATTNTVVATIPTGGNPWGIAAKPDGTRVYVTNTTGVHVINTATNTLVTTVVVGGNPRGITVTPDGSKVYVANNGTANVSVISTASNTVIATIPGMNGPQGITTSPNGANVYVANNGTNTVSVISTATNTVTGTVTVGAGPYGISITPDGSKGFVTQPGLDNVSIFSTATNLLITTVPTGNLPFSPGNFILGTIPTCTGSPKTFTITVNPTPNAVANPPSQTKCSGVPITPIVLSGNVAGTVFNWTRDNGTLGGGNVSGIAAAGSGDISGTLTNNTNAPVTVTFQITPTANGCPGTPINATVLVNPTPNAVATPASQTKCSGVAITTIVLSGNVGGTVFNWTRDNGTAGGGNVSGIAAAGSGDISGTLTNNTNAPVTVTFQITPTANGCPGTPINATVLVNPTPNAVATPPSQTVCSANAITTIVLTGNVAGTVFNWTRDNGTLGGGNVSGIAAAGSGNISGTLTNNTNAPVTVSFQITPTANGCPGPMITATVLVNPTPSAVATPSSQTICSANAITTIVLNGSPVAGTVYNWTRDNTGTVTGIAASGSGDISGTLTNTTFAPVTVTFTITPVANGCPGPQITATVLVNPTPNAVATPSSQTICTNSPSQQIVFTGSVAGTTYSWVRDNNATVTGLPSNGSGNVPSATLVNTTNAPVIVTFTITPTANGCPGPPITATIRVNPDVFGVINAPASSPICAGQDGGVIVNLPGNAPFTGVFQIKNLTTNAVQNYSWTSNTPGGPQNIAITPGSTYLPNTTSTPITYMISWVSLSDAFCTAPAGNLQGAANIQVNPLPALQVTRSPSGSPLCPGTPLTYTVSAAPGNTVPATFNYTITETGNVVPLQQGSNLPYGTVNFTAPSCPYNKTLTFTATPYALQSPNCIGGSVQNTVVIQDLSNPAFGTSGSGSFDRCDANGIATARAFTPTATNTNCATSTPVVTVQTAETYSPTCGYTGAYAAGKTGTLTTVYLATSPCGGTATITKTITITDNTVPTWTTAPGSLNQTVQYCDNAALTNAQNNFAPTATDGCASPIPLNIVRTAGVFAQGACPTQGQITNTWIATDACGNASAQFTQVITIIDNTGPVISGNTSNQVVNVGGVSCSGTLPNYINTIPMTATDCAAPGGLFPAPAAITYNNNNQGNNLIWQSPAPGTTVFGPGGTMTVSIFARDACGNTSQVNFTVTIVDNTIPTAICRNLQNATAGQANSRVVLNNAGQATINFISATSQINNGSSDNCSVITLSFAQATVVPTRTFTCADVPANTTVGTIAVTMWVSDASGNQTSCTANVDVVDNIAPVFTNCPTATQFVNKDAGCSATVPDFITLLAINATDACTPVTYTQSPVAGSVVGAGVGTIPVTITARDNHGNTTPCTFNVTFRDATPPSFGVTCPSNQTLSAAIGSCSTTASWTIPTATDNCSPSNGLGPITYTVTATGTTSPPALTPGTPGQPASAVFFIGTTTVTYTATDQAGNAQTCIFTITVNDNTNPVVTCPTFAPGNGNLNNVNPFWPIMATDPGVCTFTKTGTSWDATASDNCLLAGPNPVMYQLTRPPSIVVIGTGTSLNNVVFDKGITRVTWIATDFSGNQGVCSFDVEIRDLELPTLTCPANVVTTPNVPNCRALVPAAQTNATFSDNCPGSVLTWDVSGATPVAAGSGNIGNYTFYMGVTTVQYKVTDAAGNFRTCSFTVTVNPAIDATISGNAVVGQNVNNTSTVTFTGTGAGAVAPAQVQYTFTYNITSNVAAPQNGLTVTTGVGSSTTTVAQSNATVGNYTYTLVSVTDQNGCTKTFPNPQPSVLIQVVPGVPDLTTAYQATSSQIQNGGTIQQVFGIRNVGTVSTAGTIVFTVTNYNPLFGGLSSTAPATNGTVIIGGTPFNYQNGDWTITGVGTSLLTFTSKLGVAIPAGGVNIVKIDITRAAAGVPGNSNGIANETLTIAPGTGGGETPTTNNSFSTVITKN